ncbi:MAG TPA: YbdD/YjiX family protein [Gemmatimonadaceae bacterium]|jgi:uncharacterized short protein YbdD (DUF466 family)
MTTKEMVSETRERIQRAAKVIRYIIGVPDYDRYVAHVHARYPGTTPMCQNDFEKARITDKYSRPGGRCC